MSGTECLTYYYLTDPSGHMWSIASHIEDVAPDEMQRRLKTFLAEHEA